MHDDDDLLIAACCVLAAYDRCSEPTRLSEDDWNAYHAAVAHLRDVVDAARALTLVSHAD